MQPHLRPADGREKLVQPQAGEPLAEDGLDQRQVFGRADGGVVETLAVEPGFDLRQLEPVVQREPGAEQAVSALIEMAQARRAPGLEQPGDARDREQAVDQVGAQALLVAVAGHVGLALALRPPRGQELFAALGRLQRQLRRERLGHVGDVVEQHGVIRRDLLHCRAEERGEHRLVGQLDRFRLSLALGFGDGFNQGLFV